mgnify:CR=1 FL=1
MNQMTNDDEAAAAYLRWRRANERMKDLDAEVRLLEIERSRALDNWLAIYDARPRTERQQMEEQIEAAYTAVEVAARAEYDSKVEEAEIVYQARVEEAGNLRDHEYERISVLFGPDDPDLDEGEEEPEWTSPELEASSATMDRLNERLAVVQRDRVQARHELTEARLEKKRTSGR